MATRIAKKSEVLGANGEVLTSAPGSISVEKVVIEPVKPKTVCLTIIGSTPLLVCCWSHKARKQMLDKQMKKATRGKEAKDPQADYLASRYIAVDAEGKELWDGIPAGGVKGALVNACRAVDGLPMTLAKRMIFICSQGKTAAGQDLVRVYGDHKMHEAMVRIDSGSTADIRFRAIYENWSIKLEIEFLQNIISAEQIANLVELAGFVEGLCEHRPGSPKSCTGNNGRFSIKRDE